MLTRRSEKSNGDRLGSKQEKAAKLQSGVSEQLRAPSRFAVGPHTRRWIRFVGYWKQKGIVFKVYGISGGAEFRSPGLLNAALNRAATHLRDLEELAAGNLHGEVCEGGDSGASQYRISSTRSRSIWDSDQSDHESRRSESRK